MIFKMLLGGTWIPPLSSYQPVTITGGNAAVSPTTTASSSSSSDLTDKDLLKMMEKLEGLPNDMAALTDSLLNFYIQLQYGMRHSNSNIASRYLSAISLMRTANFNRKEYDNAFEIVKANGGLNEVAVNDRGLLICINAEKDLKLIRPEELKDNQGYQPLTNSEILQLRAYDPEMAFDSSIVRVVLLGIGMPTVTKMITDIINGLGSTNTTLSGYISTQHGKLLGGIKDLSNAIALASSQGLEFNGTSDDLYSYKIISKDLKTLIDLAMAYIYSTLPENAKSLLKTKTLGGSNQEVYSLIETLIASKVDNTLDFTMKLEAGKTADKTTAAKAAAGDKTKLNPAALLQAGYGQKETFTIQTALGGSNGILVNTVRMPIVSKEGKSIGIGTLNDVAESGFSGYLDLENVSMGGVNISSEGFLNVAVNGTSLYVGELPIDLEEYSTTGNIRPDIEMLGRYKLAQNKIQKEQITDPDKINEVYTEFKLPIMYGPNGDVLNNYKKFGIINGSAIQQAFNQNVEFADYLLETTDENSIKNVLNILQKGRSKEDRISFNERGWFNSIFDSYDHVYKGTIFIPVNEDYFTGAAGFGINPTPEEAETIEGKQQALLREQAAASSYVNPGML